MKTYLDNLQPIKGSEFFRKFSEHIHNRKKVDETEKQTSQILKQNSGSLTFYFGILNEMGIKNLILPQHAVEMEDGQDPDRPVKIGGEGFQKVIKDYLDNYIPNKRFPDCVKKIQCQKSRFFNYNYPLLKADFLFVCNYKDYAHPNEKRGHYDTTHDENGENRIYMGNGFHRFVAYGLWIAKNEFKPLELYYAHHTDV